MTKEEIEKGAIETAANTIEYTMYNVRCTCPQMSLQATGVHYRDCPRCDVREYIRQVLTSLLKLKGSLDDCN